MDKVEKQLLKVLSLMSAVLGFIIGIIIMSQWNKPAEPIVVTKIERIHDTTYIPKPVPKYIRKVDSIPYPVYIKELDTISVVNLEKEELVYTDDSTFYAVVSGVSPSLDTMKVFRTIETRTIERTKVVQKPSRWSIGVQGGMGVTPDGAKPYLGIGVSYNLLSF